MEDDTNYIGNDLGVVPETTTKWTDAVYLSPDATLDSNAILLTESTYTGGLAAGASSMAPSQ